MAQQAPTGRRGAPAYPPVPPREWECLDGSSAAAERWPAVKGVAVLGAMAVGIILFGVLPLFFCALYLRPRIGDAAVICLFGYVLLVIAAAAVVSDLHHQRAMGHRSG